MLTAVQRPPLPPQILVIAMTFAEERARGILRTSRVKKRVMKRFLLAWKG